MSVRWPYHNVHSFIELLASPSSNNVRSLNIDTSSTGSPFDTIVSYFDDSVAIKPLTLNGWRRFSVSEERLSRGFGRTGNMELTKISYDYYSHGSNLTFTLGSGGPFMLASQFRVLHSIFDSHGSEPSSFLPIVAQFPNVNKINFHGIQKIHLPTVQAMLKSGGESIHSIKLVFLSKRPSLGMSKIL
jgi:hypothetical protein